MEIGGSLEKAPFQLLLRYGLIDKVLVPESDKGAKLDKVSIFPMHIFWVVLKNQLGRLRTDSIFWVVQSLKKASCSIANMVDVIVRCTLLQCAAFLYTFSWATLLMIARC